MSRAYTDKEVRKMFIEYLKETAKYWEKTGKNTADILDGFIFSFLTLLDGATDLPAFDLVVRPHPDDKKYHIDLNENYFEDGMVINDCMMHECEEYRGKIDRT